MPECRTIKKRLGRYFDGELPPVEQRLVEDHLKQCSRCSAELQEIREIAGAFQKRMPAPPIPSDLTQRIMKRARSHIGDALPECSLLSFWKNWSFPMRFAAVGVAAVACYIGIALGSASPLSTQRAGEETKWIGMTSQGPIVTAYVGSAR